MILHLIENQHASFVFRSNEENMYMTFSANIRRCSSDDLMKSSARKINMFRVYMHAHSTLYLCHMVDQTISHYMYCESFICSFEFMKIVCLKPWKLVLTHTDNGLACAGQFSSSSRYEMDHRASGKYGKKGLVRPKNIIIIVNNNNNNKIWGGTEKLSIK